MKDELDVYKKKYSEVRKDIDKAIDDGKVIVFMTREQANKLLREGYEKGHWKNLDPYPEESHG